MKTSRKDYWSEGTTITAEYLIAWIGENQSICWPERSPLPEWFYSQVGEVIAPTVRDITMRYHREGDGRPYTEEENRGAVARTVTLRIFKIWWRIRLGTLACRRCGGKILGENFVFDWRGSGPYIVWHSECHALQQTDPQPFHAPPARKRTEAEQYRMDLDERRELVRAERHRRQRVADLQRGDTAGTRPVHRGARHDDPPRTPPDLRRRGMDGRETIAFPTEIFFNASAHSPVMTPEGEEQFVKEETSVESAEYVRTPDGKNVTVKRSRAAGSRDER